jgi:uncharacterized repeat protein (TIGR03803 family)
MKIATLKLLSVVLGMAWLAMPVWAQQRGGPEIGAAQTAAINPKERMLHRLITPTRPAQSAAGVIRDAASAEALPAMKNKEIVLHDFVSPPHGAYPSNGVIRDLEGNLYGTTNGSYSDIGGGGAHDAGVVFKIDRLGNQTVLYTFTGGADGGSPNGVIRDVAGNLYGTTGSGGASGAGVVFEVDISGNETVLYPFSGGVDGGSPNLVVRDRKGNLYGTTSSGGASGYGTVFKIDTSGNETVLHSFTGGADGAYPYGDVVLDLHGNLYGTADNGGNQVGASGAGVVFKIDTSGKETVLYTFTGGNDGAEPNGVIRDWEGNLYGTTTSGGASGAGTVFKIDTSGHATTLYTFTGGNDGGSSDAGLSRDHEGNLFGTTNSGGTAGLGVVFKVDRSGHETVLHSFVRGPEGNQPYLAGVILDRDCNLYGTTSFNGAGGNGAVYKLDVSGTATVVYAFPGTHDGEYTYNAGVTLGSDGHLYGTTDYGGGHGAGIIYQLDRDGDERVLHTFDFFSVTGYGQPTAGVTRDEAGNFYGTTFIGQADEGFGFGVVYKVDASGRAAVLHNFTGAADGGNPYGGVILDSKGNVYGTASGGGASGNGVVFEIDTSGHEDVLYSFSGGADGGGPLGSLLRDPQGNLYGTTNGGGISGAGVVFKIDTSGRETVLYTFSGGADGGYPFAGLIRDLAGNFYGTTSGGGASGAGVVFKIDSSGRETAMYSFTGGDDGNGPLWVTLARDSAGDLYGTTSGGGTSNAGVIFKVDTSGHETVLHSFTGGSDGGTPYAGVVLGPQGELYGATPFGGSDNVGVIFKVQP